VSSGQQSAYRKLVAVKSSDQLEKDIARLTRVRRSLDLPKEMLRKKSQPNLKIFTSPNVNLLNRNRRITKSQKHILTKKYDLLASPKSKYALLKDFSSDTKTKSILLKQYRNK
jgi:hypothetical protein